MVNPFKSAPPFLKLLLNPMLFASLALHGLVMMMPLLPSPEPIAEPEPEPEEVEISSLTSLIKPPPKPAPAPAPIPKAVAQPRPAVPAVRPRPVVPSPQPAPVASPTPSVSSAPVPTPTITPTPSPVAASPPAEPDYSGEFQSGLAGVATDETAGIGIPCHLFAQPELFFTPDSLPACLSSGAEPQPISAIDNILWASRRRPDDVLTELQTRFAGFSFTPMPQFGDGDLYEIKKGATVRYLNLVRATDRTATFVVIWNRDPNLSPDSAASPLP